MIAHGAARLAGMAITLGMITLGTVCTVRVSQRLGTTSPEPVGSRPGLILTGIDSAILLSSALAITYSSSTIFAALYSLYPLAPIIKAAALLPIAYAWLRVRTSADPESLQNFLHTFLTMAVALATWLIIDSALPSGWGTEQAAVAILLASFTVAIILLLRRLINAHFQRFASSPSERRHNS